MAHSCIQCQKYIVVQPRVDGNASWVDVLEVDLRYIIVAASAGRAFFNWCLLQHPEAANPISRRELKDKVVLRASMWAGSRPDNYTGQFVSLRWVNEPAIPGGGCVESYLGYLYTMAEVGKHRPFKYIFIRAE